MSTYQEVSFEQGEVSGNMTPMTLDDLDISRIEENIQEDGHGPLTIDDLTMDQTAIMDMNSREPHFVKPDMPDGIESGSVLLAKDFYEYYAFTDARYMYDLFSCRNKHMLKQLYFSQTSFWKRRANQHLNRNFEQVLFALSRHYNLCKVVKNYKIQWNRLSWYTQTIGNKKALKYILDRDYIEMLIDHKDAQMEIQRLRKSRIN